MHVHFMGIGGSGVSGLALMALHNGHTVSGCDMKHSSYTDMVEKNGGKCYIGHDPKHLDTVDLLVYSTAVSNDNLEISAAEKRDIRTITRGEFLAELIADNYVIGVSGSHGKTSTTWLTYHLFKKQGINASVYSGGKCQGQTSVFADNPWIVELDESDGSVFHVVPNMLVMTNLEHEHVDYYDSSSDLLNSFEHYIMKNEINNLIVGRGYDLSDEIYNIFTATSFPTKEELKKRKQYSNINGMDFILEKTVWFLLYEGNTYHLGSEFLPFYVLQNRAAALLALLQYSHDNDITLKKITKATWDGIPSVDRRFQHVGVYNDVVLIDDYAHHPSEVAALIDRARYEYSNFAVIFQPHRVSRFNTFYEEFKESLNTMEPLIILPIFRAGEEAAGKNSMDLFEELQEKGQEVYYFDSVDSAGLWMQENIFSLRIKALATAGAGDLNNIFNYLR